MPVTQTTGLHPNTHTYTLHLSSLYPNRVRTHKHRPDLKTLLEQTIQYNMIIFFIVRLSLKSVLHNSIYVHNYSTNNQQTIKQIHTLNPHITHYSHIIQNSTLYIPFSFLLHGTYKTHKHSHVRSLYHPSSRIATPCQPPITP